MKLIDLLILLTPAPLLTLIINIERPSWWNEYCFYRLDPITLDITYKIWDAVTERHIELLDIEDSPQWFSAIELMTFNRMNKVDPI